MPRICLTLVSVIVWAACSPAGVTPIANPSPDGEPGTQASDHDDAASPATLPPASADDATASPPARPPADPTSPNPGNENAGTPEPKPAQPAGTDKPKTNVANKPKTNATANPKTDGEQPPPPDPGAQARPGAGNQTLGQHCDKKARCRDGLGCDGLYRTDTGTCVSEKQAAAACEAKGDKWGRWGMMGINYCMPVRPDADKPCTDEKQCTGRCIVRDKQEGRCQRFEIEFWVLQDTS